MPSKKTKTAAARRKSANVAATDARIPTVLRLRGSLREDLDALAAADGRSRSNLIEKMLMEGVSKMQENGR